MLKKREHDSQQDHTNDVIDNPADQVASLPTKRRKKDFKKTRKSNESYGIIIKENKDFEDYYKLQKIIPEADWDIFMNTIRQPLPVTFRITNNPSIYTDLSTLLLNKYINNMPEKSINNEPLPKLVKMQWYPNNLCWEFDVPKRNIRNEPSLAAFHAFLIRETDIGNISRQEAVSMIPPLFMDIKSHHRIFDMCAAPGSKTVQLVEMLQASHTALLENSLTTNQIDTDLSINRTEILLKPASITKEDKLFPKGLVVANDSDNKRCYMLVHQTKRLRSPNFIVTNQDATVFPNLYLSHEDRLRNISPIKYDRILCDVPCSGDGTMRKNPLVWSRWSPLKANGLHRLQLRLAVRGAELLTDEGGRMVYSTCSMNPIENEAVIYTLLKLSEGALTLVDPWKDRQSILKHSPGMYNWNVTNNRNVIMDKPIPDNGIYATYFPPPTIEEATSYHLERCIRVYPHQQNTGGFFIAVLEKNRQMPWSKKKPQMLTATIITHDDNLTEKESNQQTQNDALSLSDIKLSQGKTSSTFISEESMTTHIDDNSNKEIIFKATDQTEIHSRPYKIENRPFAIFGKYPRPPKKRKGFKEDPFIFVDPNDLEIQTLTSFYGLTEDFPWTNCLTRSDGKAKNNIYFVTDEIASILRAISTSCNIKIINTGLRAFCRSDTTHEHTTKIRLTQEGCCSLFNYITKRKIELKEEDVIQVLLNDSISFSSVHKDTLDELKQLEIGPIIFIYNPATHCHTSQSLEIQKETIEPIEKPVETFSVEETLKKPYTVSKELVGKVRTTSHLTQPLILCGWRSNWSLRLLVTKQERQHYLILLGFDLVSDAAFELKKINRMETKTAKLCEDIIVQDPDLNTQDHDENGDDDELLSNQDNFN